MSRSGLHTSDAILDAARGLALEHGANRVQVGAIARRSGAPVGSLYHRFKSLDGLLIELWIRAVRRSQGAFLAAIEHPEPRHAAINAALSIYNFVHDHPDDARLLVCFRRDDLVRDLSSPELARELADLNKPLQAAIENLARRLFGTVTAATIEQTVLAVSDLPLGIVRRHLVAGRGVPPQLKSQLEALVRTVLDTPLSEIEDRAKCLNEHTPEAYVK